MNTTAFVLRREPDTQRGTISIDTCFRLVHKPDPAARRQTCEKALAALRQMQE